MQLADLKARAEHERPELPVGQVVDALVDGYRGVGTVYVPAEIAEASKVSDLALVLKTLDLLSKRPYSVLESHWVFFDESNNIYELEDDAVAETFTTSIFYHPVTGDIVPEYKDSLRLLYEATQDLQGALSSSEKKRPRFLLTGAPL
jgi:hypothetical protein